MKTRNPFLPFWLRGTDDQGGGFIDINDIEAGADVGGADDDQGAQGADDGAGTPAFDTRTTDQELEDRAKAEAIRQQARADLLAEQAAEAQRQQQQQSAQDEDDAILEQIIAKQYEDPKGAEKLRIELAQRRAANAFQAQYGQQLQASGVQLAVSDARQKLSDVPAEIQPYIDQSVQQLGIQGPIPPQMLEGVRQLAYGAAALAGVQIGKPQAQRTVRAAGAEAVTITTTKIPTEYQSDADAFERAFGKAALGEAMKEAPFA